MASTVYEAPGTRYIAEALGETSWISSRSDWLQRNGAPTHAAAAQNAFGAVTFRWFSSAEAAEANAQQASSWAQEVAVVPVSSRPETLAEANPDYGDAK